MSRDVAHVHGCVHVCLVSDRSRRVIKTLESDSSHCITVTLDPFKWISWGRYALRRDYITCLRLLTGSHAGFKPSLYDRDYRGRLCFSSTQWLGFLLWNT